jgi:hypothetical protein
MCTGYDLNMRTTISLEARLAERVKRKAASEGLSVSAFIAKTLDDALKRVAQPAAPPFRLVTVKGGGLQAGVDLDRPNALVTADDEQAFERGRGA